MTSDNTAPINHVAIMPTSSAKMAASCTERDDRGNLLRKILKRGRRHAESKPKVKKTRLMVNKETAALVRAHYRPHHDKGARESWTTLDFKLGHSFLEFESSSPLPSPWLESETRISGCTADTCVPNPQQLLVN